MHLCLQGPNACEASVGEVLVVPNTTENLTEEFEVFPLCCTPRRMCVEEWDDFLYSALRESFTYPQPVYQVSELDVNKLLRPS